MPEFKIDFLESYDDEAIVAELKRIAALCCKNTVTKADIQAHGRLSYAVVNKRFGSLRKALEAAGLSPQRYMEATEEEMLTVLVNLRELTLEKEGRRPQRKDLKVYMFPISGDTYMRRFGSWKKALTKACNWVESVDAEEPSLETIADKVGAQRPPKKPERLSLRKRFFVMKRDSFACVGCGASGPGVRLEVDHRVPRARGGTDALDNLQTLCFECNRGKSYHLLDN